MLTLHVNGEVFICSFDDLERAVIGVLKRFAHSIMSDEDMGAG